MGDGDDIGLALIGVVAGVYFFFQGLHELRLKRLIKNTPTSKTRSLAMGLVELKGEAKINGEPLIAPMSKKSCVYYKYLIEEYRSSGKSSSWKKVEEKKSPNEFYLKDNTGKVLIDPSKFKTDFKIDYTREATKSRKELQEFLVSKGYKMKGIFKKRMRYSETYIKEGDQLYVLGKTQKKDNNTVVVTGDQFKYAYISEKEEEELHKSYSNKVKLKVWGGPGMTFLGLTYLLFRFGIL